MDANKQAKLDILDTENKHEKVKKWLDIEEVKMLEKEVELL